MGLGGDAVDGLRDEHRDDAAPYGVDTIRLRITFPAAPVSQGYNGRMWRMRPLRGWTGGQAAGAARPEGEAAAPFGSDTAGAQRDQAFADGLARYARFSPDAQHSQYEATRASFVQQAGLSGRNGAGLFRERYQTAAAQALAALAAVKALPIGQRFAANSPKNTATDAVGAPQPDKAWMRSVNQNPAQFVGKSAQEIADEFTAHGWPATLRQSTQGSQRALIVDMPEGASVRLVEVHPGDGRHGGAYTRVSTDHGMYKYIDPSTYERTGPERATTKLYDAKTLKPISPDSLPMRGRSGPVGTTQPSPAEPRGRLPAGTTGEAVPNLPLEGGPPGAIRPPLYDRGTGSVGGQPNPAGPAKPLLEE